MAMENKKQIIGEWSKESVLGRGGFGVVTQWRNQISGEMIALKLIRTDSDNDKSKRIYRERLLREIDDIKKLVHPNIVKLLPLPEQMSHKLSDNIVLICMEYCVGGDIRKELNKPENCCGLGEYTIRKLLNDVKNGCEYLHKMGIIHGDIKPENIVIQQVGNEIVYKLIDLGHQRELDQNKLYTSFIGTLQYIAPEVIFQSQSASVDYWSLGVVCHEIITGFRPFPSDIPPLKWASLIKSKDYEDISICRNENGVLEFNKHLPAQHHISQFLTDEFEYWLRLALESDGKIRGRNINNEIIIFKALDSILNKKIITIFSTVSLKQLSYEVDNSTAILTVKGWIQRDTKQLVDDQLILLPSGETISDDQLACSCWDPTNEVAMAYVFNRSGIRFPREEAKVPTLIANIIEQSKKLYPYYYLRRMWSQALHFIQNQLYVCATFLEALAVKLLAILKNVEDLTALDGLIASEIQQAIGKMKLCNESLSLNEENIKKYCAEYTDNPDVVTEWKKRSRLLHEHLSQIYAISKTLTLKITEAKFNFDKAQCVHDEGIEYKEELKKILEASYKVYKSLHTMPKELKESETNSVEISALICKTVEIRNNFFKKYHNDDNFRYILNCENEISDLKIPLEEFNKSVKELNVNIVTFHCGMLQDLWNICFHKNSAIKHSSKNVGNDMPNLT